MAEEDEDDMVRVATFGAWMRWMRGRESSERAVREAMKVVRKEGREETAD